MQGKKKINIEEKQGKRAFKEETGGQRIRAAADLSAVGEPQKSLNRALESLREP